MPQTITRTVYTFEELSDAAKEKARDWWREGSAEDFDTDFLYEDFERMGKLLGIEFDRKPVKLMGGGTRYDPTIYWSGFASQGDGACFEGRYAYAKGAAKAIAKETGGTEHVLIDNAKRLQAVQRRNFYRLEAIAKHRGHYYHSGCMSVDVFDRDDNYREIGDAEEEVTQCLREFADWMYKQLDAENDYRMSDENVDESIRCNEYTFTEDGKREG
jgi:hypothetical protein